MTALDYAQQLERLIRRGWERRHASRSCACPTRDDLRLRRALIRIWIDDLRRMRGTR